MSRIWLVTGTDTGVGKTTVACGLARALRSRGVTVAVRKPAETGCETRGGELFPVDAAALRAAAGSEEALETLCPYRFAEPLAPAVAARRAGRAIDVEAVVGEVLERAGSVDVMLVEGAGGLLVPLRDRYSYAELARDLGARLLLVVGARLGAINHALLTLEVARSRGLEVGGVVVNHFTTVTDLATETLAASLRELTDVPLLAEIRFGADAAASLGALATA